MASIAQAAPQYRVVAADLLCDRDVILDVWRRNLSSIDKLEEKYEWQFLGNPYGPGKCWILMSGGRPIGTACLGMRAIQMHSVVERAGVACDLAVDKEHRFLMPAIMLQRALTSSVGSTSGIRMVYGMPNHNGAATVRRAGYREAGEVHRYTKVLKLSPYLERAGKGLLTQATGAAADMLYHPWLALTDRLDQNYVVEKNAVLDERFDKLWASRARDFSIATVRDGQYLRWRFAACPLRQYTTLALLSKRGGELTGYTVHYMDGARMILADILTTARTQDASALITAALIQARSLGAASLSLQCAVPNDLLAVLSRRGFRQRTESPPQTGTRQTNPNLQFGGTVLVYSGFNSHTTPPGTWYFTAGDEPYN